MTHIYNTAATSKNFGQLTKLELIEEVKRIKEELRP